MIHYTKPTLLITLLLLLNIYKGTAQHHTHQNPARCVAHHSSPNFEKWLRQRIINSKNKRTTAEVVTIPVVVHVIHNGEPVGQGTNISKAQIESQIRILNEDFRKKLGTNGHNTHPAGADIEIEFQLAIQSPEGIPTDGIVRVQGSKSVWDIPDDPTLKGLSYWDSANYLNIWVCALDGFLGYAQFPETNLVGVPQNSTTKNPATDGIVVHYQAFGDVGSVAQPYHLGRTTTHEIGHYLGLLHISGDGACPTDDYCIDTPPVNDQTSGCPSPKPIACNGVEAQIENYMDYSNDACMNMFTKNQKDRMRAVLTNSPRRNFASSLGLQVAVLTPDNASIRSITQIQNSTCDTEVTPKVLLRNLGNNILTSLTIKYEIDGSNIQTFQWQGNLASLDTTTVTLPTTQVSREKHELKVYGDLPNGKADSQPNNDSKTQSFNVLALTSLPLTYDFTDTTILNSAWQIDNPDNNETWKPITLSVQNQSTINEAMTLAYFDYPQSGQLDYLISPLLDVTNAQNLTLSFRVAYAPFQDGDLVSRDGLKVGITTDCGKTFTIVYEQYGDTLATSEAARDNWKPVLDNQWRTEKISLNNWLGQNNLRVAFIGVNDYGNNIYLDDVSLTTTSISTNPNDFVSITPNPAEGSNIRVNLSLPNKVPTLDWALYDITGKKVNSGQVTDAQFQSIAITGNSYQQGVYIFKIITPSYSVNKRIVLY